MTKETRQSIFFKSFIKLCEYALVCLIFILFLLLISYFNNSQEDIEVNRNIIVETVDGGLLIVLKTSSFLDEPNRIDIFDSEMNIITTYSDYDFKTIISKEVFAIELPNFPKDLMAFSMKIYFMDHITAPIKIYIRKNSENLFEIEAKELEK